MAAEPRGGRRGHRISHVVVASLAVGVSVACGARVVEPTGEGGASPSETGGASPGTGGTAGAAGEGGGGCIIVVCDDGETYDCGDCEDNDGDGFIDLQDPQCQDPCGRDYEDIECPSQYQECKYPECPCSCITGCCTALPC